LTERSLEEAKWDVLGIDVPEDQIEHLITARFMLDRYYEYYSRREPEWDEVIETEQTIGFKYSDDLALMGKLDGLVRSDGDIWIVEHKTTYSVDRKYLEKVALDGQITFYMMLVNEVFDIMPKGVIYNVICRPRKYRRKNETIKKYHERAKEEYRAAPKSYMDRQRAFRDPEDLDDLRGELAFIHEQIKTCRNCQLWPKNTGVCYLRGRKCQFTDLCKSGENPSTLMRYEQVGGHSELDFDDANTIDMEDLDVIS
jgi:hypothetical protein